MIGKCWSIQYIDHDSHEFRDKVFTAPVYFTTNAVFNAIHDWIHEMNDIHTNVLPNIDEITEEFLANTEPGYHEEFYLSSDGCISVVVACHRIA